MGILPIKVLRFQQFEAQQEALLECFDFHWILAEVKSHISIRESLSATGLFSLLSQMLCETLATQTKVYTDQ